MQYQRLGKLAEKIACHYLKNKGYEILARNYISHLISGPQRGEIDIIAQKNGTFHFIEVKSLNQKNQNTLIIPPEIKVNLQKQRKIIKTAKEWFAINQISLESKWQIDIIVVRINQNQKTAKIQYFQNVFGE